MDFMKRDNTPGISRLHERKSKPEFSSSIKEEISTPLKLKKSSLNFNDSEDVRKVIVAVRVRPFNEKESSSGKQCPFTVNSDEIIVKNGYSYETSTLAMKYSYDEVFWSAKQDDHHKFCDQQKVFNHLALPLVTSTLEGYNMCLFAYGQTGSGKSYSMMGYNNVLTGDEAGIIPRFCNELFHQAYNNKSIQKIEFSMSFYEIYNEKIHDLLTDATATSDKISLRVREHPVNGPYVEGLSKHQTNSIEDVYRLLTLGNNKRTTSSTIHNNNSSRSHCIIEISLECIYADKYVKSKVSLVDLAGSERVSHYGVTGEHFKEGLSINKSLLTLGKVITSLSERKGSFIPYRESVLTWLLKESLGGNSRTVMLATISPSLLSLDETLSTLRYACQARSILNKVSINEDPQHKLIRELKAEVDRLKSLHDYKKERQTKICQRDNKSDTLMTREYIQYENELSNIEKAKKAVEVQLQAELSRIGLHLQAAERRRDELESQKNIFLEKITTNSVSQYKSDFYDNLQEILNSSMSGVSTNNKKCLNKDVVENMLMLKQCLNNLKHMCDYDKENCSRVKQIQPLVEYMDKCHQDMCEILNIP